MTTAIKNVETDRQDDGVVISTKTKVTYTLELDEDTAAALRQVLERVGGELDGPRGHISSIYDALAAVGAPQGVPGWTLIASKGRPQGYLDALYFDEV